MILHWWLGVWVCVEQTEACFETNGLLKKNNYKKVPMFQKLTKIFIFSYNYFLFDGWGGGLEIFCKFQS